MIKVKNITVGLLENKKKILKNVSLSVSKGKIVGLVGESGSGKSMIAKAILNHLPNNVSVFSGEIIAPTELGKTISIVSQHPMSALNPVKRIGKQIAEAIYTHQKIDRNVVMEKVYSLLKEVQFDFPEQIINKYPHELSGGQCQRILIAIAIANNPQVILLDEPTTALDVTTQKEIILLLLQLKESYECTILFISHNLPLVYSICDEVYIIYQGEIVEYGSVDNVFYHAKHEYTKYLIDNII